MLLIFLSNFFPPKGFRNQFTTSCLRLVTGNLVYVNLNSIDIMQWYFAFEGCSSWVAEGVALRLEKSTQRKGRGFSSCLSNNHGNILHFNRASAQSPVPWFDDRLSSKCPGFEYGNRAARISILASATGD